MMLSRASSSTASKATLVFIHGWCCNPHDFNKQVAYFANDYKIIVPDYSSVIKHDAQSASSIFNACVDYIKQQISIAHEVILIGHSMGGAIALSLMQQLSDKVKAVAIIDTTMPSSPQQKQLFHAFTASLLGQEGEQHFNDFIHRRMINREIDNIQITEHKLHEMLEVWNKNPALFTQVLNEAAAFNTEIAVRESKCPLLYIGGTPAFGDLVAIKALNNDAVIQQIASGHFVMLNQPDQLNTVLEDFLAVAYKTA